MKKLFKMKKIVMLALTMVLIFTACQSGPKDNESSSSSEAQSEVSSQAESKTASYELTVYSGAGLKGAMEEIKAKYEAEKSAKLNIIYAGSGQLLAQLEMSGKGDVFVVGSKPTFDDAAKKGLTNEGKPVAFHTPVIVTQKGNPKNVKGLKDLAMDGLKVALGDPKANAIGKTSVKMFEKNKIEGVDKNVVVKTATVNELYQAIKSGNADAAIVTRDGAVKQGDIEIIEIPEDQIIDQIITMSTLKSAEDKEKAEDFMAYCLSEDSMKIWEKHGFKPAKNDK